MEKKIQQLMPILPIRVSLSSNYHKGIMQRKHGWLIKIRILKIVHQVLMVLIGEVKMSRNVSES